MHDTGAKQRVCERGGQNSVGHPREESLMMAYEKGKPLSLDVEELLTDLWAGRKLRDP